MGTEYEIESRSQKWRRLVIHELIEYLFNFAFLAIFLIAFAWYRRLILASYHIQYLGYWVPLVEAAILAKVIMIGDALHVGRRFQNRPLAVTTFYRTVVFIILVVLFSFGEHVLGAVIHGGTVAEGAAQFADKGLDVLLAWCVVFFAAFLPFFALKEIERAFGAEKVRAMFFKGRISEVDGAAKE